MESETCLFHPTEDKKSPRIYSNNMIGRTAPRAIVAGRSMNIDRTVLIVISRVPMSPKTAREIGIALLS